ncbi:MAG: sugar ABC transporter ATP-binding protein [Clostridium sp. SCN 57-10]|nr:MAG: sugar ABC transporter ATP-binding protein [Clostridium sp. SCN 57-10]
MAQVTASKLCKTYPNGVKAVRDFNLEIGDREFIVLVGPSGCGKSTMLRMIAGLEDITSGELTIGGRRVNGVAPKDRDVAMVFQNYALYPHMTVYENMALGLTMRRIDKTVIREKVMQAAELLDIVDLLDRKPGQMSGGQQQRVALGRAIVRQPSVFLLDEPLSNLDAKLRNQMRLEIIKLHRQLQTTFVYVTHDQTEAMTMADRIVVMDQGYIQQIGTPEELYRRPRNTFVASFIGVPNINFIPCTVEREDGHAYACFAGHRVALPDAAPALTGDAVLGVRPEDVRLCEQPSEMEATMELTEMAGSDNYLHLTVGGIKLVAKCSSRLHFGEGERVAIQFAEEGLLLFPPNHESV